MMNYFYMSSYVKCCPKGRTLEQCANNIKTLEILFCRSAHTMLTVGKGKYQKKRYWRKTGNMRYKVSLVALRSASTLEVAPAAFFNLNILISIHLSSIVNVFITGELTYVYISLWFTLFIFPLPPFSLPSAQTPFKCF